jgi:hypothetical protein
MTAEFEIESAAGIVALWDAVNSPVLGTPRDARFAAAFQEQARIGKFFFIEADDEADPTVRYHVQVLVEENPAESLHETHEHAGGSFRLELPSGTLVLCGLGDGSKPSNVQQPVNVTPGTYLLSAMTLRPFDSNKEKKRDEELLGLPDARYARVVEKIALCGCLGTLLLAILLLIPPTRRQWRITIPILLTPWLVHLVLRAMPRYRRIEKARADSARQLPHFILRLKRSSVAPELPGGWIRGV